MSAVEYCWTIHVTDPPQCKIDGSVCTTTLPDWGCYKIELTVRDKACGTARTSFHEVALIPPGVDVCTPGNPDFSFLYPTPDPTGIYAIGSLSNPSPGMGSFEDRRPLEVRVLVTPKCYCEGADPEDCAAALVFSDTPTTPPGAPSDLSDPGDDVQFRLVVRRLSASPPFFVDHDLNAEVRVTDLCPNVDGGPKYYLVTVDDLGEIPWSAHLDETVFSTVFLQGRTNCVREVQGSTTVCVPPVSTQWRNIGGPLKMVNHPTALDDAFWSGHYDEMDATYRFTVNGSDDPEEPYPLGDSQAMDFGIVDAGVPAYQDNQVNTGFTSRIACQAGQWLSEDGTGSSSGNLMENEIDAVPQIVGGSEFSVPGFAGSDVPAYEWCDHSEIFEHEMSQELFRAIIYAGFIGPIPVNIWASVGFGLEIMMDAYLEFRVSPFAPLPSGNFVETQFTLVSSLFLSIPCQIGADILGGIATVVLRLRPEAYFEFDPYVVAGLRATPQIDIDYYLEATFSLFMDVEACIQTIIFGEQCLPTIEIPLVDETNIFPPHGTNPTPESCGEGDTSSVASGGALPAGTFTVSSYEIANMPVSIVSPDGTVVVDAWASEESTGKVVKVCVTESGCDPIVFQSGQPGLGWYFLDPQAAFLDDDTVVFTGT
ncbi:MAG: hypothetical protein KDB69_00515, partial [Acidimicrobiia bacterium]|nr:hypothetical protein [Acidimicrobiia bacterium]